MLFCFYLLASGDHSAKETVQLSIILTVLSITGSWFASRYYSEYSFNANLRTFALKAAEKVNNLSNELDRLALYLQQEDESDGSEAALVQEQRTLGAIHIIHTLKSVNDGSLSDWKGVIGDELAAQQEERQDRDEELRELVDRVESFLRVGEVPSGVDEYANTVRAELDDLRKETRLLLSQVTGTPIRRPRKNKYSKKDVTNPCPNCSTELSYRQRPKKNSRIKVDCNSCGARLYSRIDDGKFVLHVREPQIVDVHCGSCANELSVALDPLQGSAVETECPKCKSQIRVYRDSQLNARFKIVGQPTNESTLSEEIIERVKSSMPPQPWETGSHRTVAEQLNLHPAVVSAAIQILIKRGVFMVQVDGVLYSEMVAGGA